MIHKFQKLNSEPEQAMMAYLEVDDDDDDELDKYNSLATYHNIFGN
jgi:hypothetical protein